MKGYILIEFMVAAVLFALASSGVSTSLVQGMKTHARVQQSFRTYDPFRILFLKIEKDLRNTVELKKYPFEGTNRRIRFPAFLSFVDEQGKDVQRLCWVEYEVRDKALVRKNKAMKPNFKEKEAEERILLQGFESFNFSFAFKDEDGRIVFYPFWEKDSYQGIPRAVKIETKPLDFSKIISIPQGKLGWIPEEKKNEF